MRNKRAAALVILAVALAAVFALLNDPPIGSVSSDDASDYMRVNKFVKNKLESEFPEILPETIPQNAKNAEYHYRYSCGLMGDASFYINLCVEYGSEVDVLNESKRLQKLNPLSVLSEEGITYLIFAGTEDAFDAYLDDIIRDGSLFHFNIIAIDESARTIEYSAAYCFDGSNKPEHLTETVLNVKNAGFSGGVC